MALEYEPKPGSRPTVLIGAAPRSLLLLSSGVVRKCEKVGVTTSISKWVTKWGRSAASKA